MTEAHINNPTINLAGPDYIWQEYYDPSDILHFQGQGYHLIGETAARAILQATCTSAQKSDVTYATAATCSGTAGTITFNVPYGSLVLDTVNVDSVSQSGIRFTDSGGEKSIASVSVASATQLDFTLDTATTGSGMEVHIGTTAHPDPRTSTTVPSTNIRDSSGDVWKSTLDGRRLDSWAAHQSISV